MKATRGQQLAAQTVGAGCPQGHCLLVYSQLQDTAVPRMALCGREVTTALVGADAHQAAEGMKFFSTWVRVRNETGTVQLYESFTCISPGRRGGKGRRPGAHLDVQAGSDLQKNRARGFLGSTVHRPIGRGHPLTLSKPQFLIREILQRTVQGEGWCIH